MMATTDVGAMAEARRPSLLNDEVDKAGATEDTRSMTNSESSEPSPEDLKALRRISGKIPWTAYTVTFVEFCERFSWYGTTAVCKYKHYLSHHRRPS